MARTVHDPRSVVDADGAGEHWKHQYAAYYRAYAAEIRDFADRQCDDDLRDKLSAVADDYEKLADHLDPELRAPPAIRELRLAL